MGRGLVAIQERCEEAFREQVGYSLWLVIRADIRPDWRWTWKLVMISLID